KGNKERITVLPVTTLELLKEYVIRENIKGKESYIFEGQGVEHISESSISRSFRDLVKKLGLDSKITIHSLRRSFATHLLRMETDIETVKELMGHNSITTTSSYAQVVYAEKKIKNPLDSESYE
ncbi:MAG: tyrosine-type recombinase/integrase, partial [Bacilli bacterium]|nr:tyrosine-type recombinase/integrase [Bacilli bacterium]